MPKRKHKANRNKRQKHGTGIYVLSGGFPFISKVGITTNFDARLNGIKAETDAGARPILRPIPQPFALETEQAIHSIYRFANIRREGSGGTEWFWNVSPICGLALCILWYLYWPDPFKVWNVICFVCFFLNPVFWLDGILLVLLSRLFWALLALACAGLVWHSINH